MLALVARDGARPQLGRLGREPAGRLQDGDRHRHRRACRTGRSTSSPTRAASRSARSSGSRRASTRRSRRRSASRTCSRPRRAGYNLIFARRLPELHAPSNAVAPRFPNQQFAGIDERVRAASTRSRRTPPASVFAEHEAGYLVGYLAALAGEEAGRPADHQRRRRQQRAGDRAATSAGTSRARRRRTRRSRSSSNYANDPTFSDQAKCKETALGQIQQGSQAIFQVAGGCGLGALHGREGGEDLGHRRRRRPALPRLAHADERAQARGQGGHGSDQARVRRQARRRSATTSTTSRTTASASAPSARRCRRRSSRKTIAVGKLIAAGKIKVKPIIKFKAR